MPPPATPPAAEVSEGSTSAVAAVPTVNLPAFTPNDAAPWFKRVEALFRIKGISNSNRKADYVIGALPPETFTRISDWLDDHGSDLIAYDDIKRAIIQECQMSPEEKSQRLLELMKTPLGDQRPSDAFREIHALTKIMKDNGETEFLNLSRVLWMTRLPPEMRVHITDFASRPTTDLLRLADSVRGTSRLAQPSTVAQVHQQNDDSDDDLALAAQRRRPSSHPSNQRPVSDASRKPWCSYHRQFGRNARNCRAPCHFPKNM